MAFRIEFLFFGALVVFSVVYMAMYAKLPTSTSSITSVIADKRESYHVKVLPNDLDDESLNSLPKESFSYLTVIDAGSTGSRAHVYKYGRLGNNEGPVYILPQHTSKKFQPRLSSFADQPQDAGASFSGMIDFLKQEVPEADWSATPVWLIATAGLRMLEPAQSEAVLVSVREFLSDNTNSPFLFRPAWARIISGNEEGGFGWIAYNYLRKIIGPKRDTSASVAPYAVVEMGGASAQVSQLAPSQEEADKIPSEFRFSFTIEKETFHLYTYSYLGFGAEEGREQFNKLLTSSETLQQGGHIEDPCLNVGYQRHGSVPRTKPYEGPAGEQWHTNGAANAESGYCTRSVKSIFGTGTTDVDCSVPGTSVFDCVYQPSFVTDSPNMLLFENFYYMTSAIGVKEHTATAEDLNMTKPNSFPLITTPEHILSESNHYCSLEYDALRPTYPLDAQPTDVITKMCFVSSFAYNFLTTGLKLPSNKLLTIQNQVGENEIEIALGAAYKELSDLLLNSELSSSSEI